MKRPLVISLAGFYLLVSLGLTLNVHYCMGQIEEISISAAAKHCCCAGMEMPGCCDDEQVELSLEEEHAVPQPPELPTATEALPVQISFLQVRPKARLDENRLQDLPDPPLLARPPAWIRFCAPVFYG